MKRLSVNFFRAALRQLASVIPAFLFIGLISVAAPSVNAQDNWNGGVSNQWKDGGNWSTGLPNGGDTVVISNATNNPVIINGINPSIQNLTLSNAANAVTVDYGYQLQVGSTGPATISNAGTILLNGGSGTNTFLILGSNTSLQGGGSLVLSTASGGGTAFVQQAVGGLTLTNVDNKIQGSGIIGNNGLAVINQAAGTILANASGQVLALQGSSSVTNAGLLQAGGGGILQLNGILVNNSGGNITANTGSSVQLLGNTTVQGGSLTNSGGTLGTVSGYSANLDGSTCAGAVTLHGTYTGNLNSTTNLAGTINNLGNIQVNGGSGTNTFLTMTADTALHGGGTVTLSTAPGGGSAFINQASGGLTLTNVDNTIQGAGIIGNNGLTVINQSTINANTSGQALTLQGLGSLTNSNSLQANSGGILQLNGVSVNNSGGTITANTGSVVQLFGNTTILGGALTNNGGTLGTISGTSANLNGSTGAGAVTLNGTYTSDLNSSTNLAGTINNLGNIQVNGGSGTNTFLTMTADTALHGGGTVTLSTAGGGGSAFINQASGGLTLTNVDNTIQGAGIIGNNGLTVINQSTINANASGQVLTLQGLGSLTNSNSLQANSGGILQLNGVSVNNSGGVITANSGSAVQLMGNTSIQGGTLTNNGGTLGTVANTSAILNGNTGSGAVTINGTYTSDLNSTTYLEGTINNQGNIQLNGGNGTNSFLMMAADTSLHGGGTVTLSTASGGGSAFINQASGGLTLTNVDNTIQGAGIIGNNGLTVINQSTINANASGQALTLQGLGSLTNSNSLQANSGGILQLNGVSVNNSGGTITANSGSAVQLMGNTSIQGGMLTNNGGTLGTVANASAILNGSTGSGAVTINGTYTSDLNSTTYLEGTINNQGNIQLNGGNGTNSFLSMAADTSLHGGGTVTLSTASGGGNAYLNQASGGITLTNVDNTIQGAGVIGNNGLTVVNQATIDANAAGQVLALQGLSLTNSASLQASSGGILQLNSITVNNAGGSITANSGSSVQLTGNTVIQGGTLANNGGTLGTIANTSAVLDGSTGSGAVTINGTYTSDLNSTTFLAGTINNQGSIQLNGGNGTNSFLTLAGNTSLHGGGTVTVSTASGGGTAFMNQAVGGLTLTNVDNTIQGNGVIGNNGLAVVNGAAGTVLSNLAGQTLSISGASSVTNNGTFQANSGSTLLVNSPLTNYNGTTSTLTGGTYNALSGTIALVPQGNVITTNAAAILLDGSSAKITDVNGADALAGHLTTNSGSFTIQNGANLTSSLTDFINAGHMTVGSNSTFTVGGGHDFLNTGYLQGTGTIQAGNLVNSGTVHPGDSPGILSVTGNYAQTSIGHLDIQLGGANPGSGFSQLNVTGNALLDGILDLSLIHGFVPFNGEHFVILTSTGLSGFFSHINGLHQGNVTFTVEYSPPGFANDVVINASVSGNSVPEPGSVVMFGMGLFAVCGAGIRRQRLSVVTA